MSKGAQRRGQGVDRGKAVALTLAQTLSQVGFLTESTSNRPIQSMHPSHPCGYM